MSDGTGLRPRNESDRICLIVNPSSAGGATARRLPAIRSAAERWFDRFEIRETEGPGHASELARAAADEGFEIVAAVGGDGTANEVVNGLVDGEKARREDCVFTVIPGGTGSDLIRSLGIPRDLDEAMGVAARGLTLPTDVVAVSCAAAEGEAIVERICLNVCGFGANGEVVRRANLSSKRFGGTLTFLGATASTLLEYQPAEVRLRWIDEEGDEHRWEGRLLSAFLANGHYCGGGMWVGRGGSMQDGLLDLALLPPLGIARTALHAHRLFTGTIREAPGTVHARVREIEAETDGTAVRVDVDGEQPGLLPLRAKVLPKALRIRGVWAGSAYA